MNDIRQKLDPRAFDSVVSKLRYFFTKKGFKEVHTQSRLSILAACEDPTTIQTFNYAGNIWPLPQTGQMWLEYELLNAPKTPGFFCLSTSYRYEQNPVPGRHDLIFPMFEFEMPTDMAGLQEMELELLDFLGIAKANGVEIRSYDQWKDLYEVELLEANHEQMMYSTFGNAQMITHFPQYTSPFWNMKKVGEHAQKIDVIICGNETIGSAERATDKEEMAHLFHNISDGMYADILYNKFGKDRVEAELNDFLNHDFFPRSGGGIGMTRLVRAMTQLNLI